MTRIVLALARKSGVVLAILAGLLLAAQAVPVDRTNPPVEGDLVSPAEVKVIVRRACYDCHSHETMWPWYSRVAPISWLVANDVREGRAELNFSTWSGYEARTRRKKLKESAEEIADGAMPPRYYSLLHPGASLTREESEALGAWIAAEIARLAP